MTSPEALEEARRRLPSIRLIEDQQIRDQTAQVASRAPDYFWSVPASSSETLPRFSAPVSAAAASRASVVPP